MLINVLMLLQSRNWVCEKKKVQDNIYVVLINNKSIFLISPIQRAEPVTLGLLYLLSPGNSLIPGFSVPIPNVDLISVFDV